MYEPFGIINLEAMACGAPVVASATGGILEVVVEKARPGTWSPSTADPVTTFPTEPGPVQPRPRRPAHELLQDPAHAKAMGEAGRKRVEEHFSWTAIADQTIALYQSLISIAEVARSERWLAHRLRPVAASNT